MMRQDRIHCDMSPPYMGERCLTPLRLCITSHPPQNPLNNKQYNIEGGVVTGSDSMCLSQILLTPVCHAKK